MRIGVDIIEIDRVALAAEKEAFVNRLLTKEEAMYCRSRNKQAVASMAGIFAAKEAFVKALGTGLREGAWVDIAVGHDALGAPVMTVQGPFATRMRELGFTDIQVSISHCQTYAIAQVLLQ